MLYEVITQMPVSKVPVTVPAAPADVPVNMPPEQPVVVRNHPATGVDSPDAGSSVAASELSKQAPVGSPGPAAEKPEASAPAAGRSFRDALPGGGHGPLMVELPATGFLMGSAGNSLNS